MVESWLIEILKAVGKIFFNPLLYWSLFLVIIAGYMRIKQERINFGIKVFDVFSEWKNTWVLSVCIGLLISLLTVGIGMVFTYETILILSIVIIILSLTFKLTMLSASYTIGITYLVLLFLPTILENQTFININLSSAINFTSLVILLGVFLFVEALLVSRIRQNETYPNLTKSNRGVWIGQHHLKKLMIIPFFVVLPTGLITPFAPFWPHFSLGGESFSLLLVPFLIGVDHIVRGNYPRIAAKKLAKSISLLGLIVIVLAIGSIYLSWLSLIAVFVAIIGREYINYKHRSEDKEKIAYFNQTEKGLKILAIIPGTPAARLNILVGETIVKVNGRKVKTVDQFYEALQASGAFFKLDILDDAGEVRFAQNAFYEGDHHELGIIFIGKPHHDKRKVN